MAKKSEEATEVLERKTVASEKLKALQLTLDKLEKTYGKGTIMKMGDTVVEPMDSISTGSLGLNIALGIGGLPRGRVVEIYGPESSGKTTLAIHAIASVQRAGGIAAIIDAEHAFDRFYAEKLKPRLGQVAIVFCLDSLCLSYDALYYTTSLRGATMAELRVKVLEEGVHSGDASGIVPSSFRIIR